MSERIVRSVLELKSSIEGKIGEFEKLAVENSDPEKVKAAEAELQTLEAEYAESERIRVFSELRGRENPVLSAVMMHDYETLSHRVNRDSDTGSVIGVELVYRPVQVDLVRFCRFCKLPTAWQFKVEKLNQLLTLRDAQELKLSSAEMKNISKSFYMNEKAREIDIGKTPTSNTQVLSLIQSAIDDVLFLDDGKGKNSVRVNSHDLAYIIKCRTKRSTPLKVSVCKNQMLHKLFVDVMYRITTGQMYGLDYKIVNGNKAPAIKTTVEPAAEPKKDGKAA